MALNDKQIDDKLAKLPDGRDKESVATRNEILQKVVGSLRERGWKYHEIADRVGIGIIKVQTLSYANEVEKVEPTTKNVVNLRDKEQMSWGKIAAATSLTETAVKKMYSETTGKSHREADLGRGGRPPKEAKAAKKTTKTTAKKTATKKQPAKTSKATAKKTAKKTSAKRAPRKKQTAGASS